MSRINSRIRAVAPALPGVVLVSLMGLMGACQDGATAPTPMAGSITPSFAKGGAGGGGAKPATRIVFASQRDQPGNMDIYSSNPDGTALTRLTVDPALDDYPVLSHDGARIAFVSTRFGGKSVFVMNVDGTGVTQYTAVAVCSSPTWSPDDSRIAFACWNGDDDSEIYSMSSSSPGPIAQLTNNAVTDLKPTWSSRGPSIAFQSIRDGNFEIYKMADDGTAVTRLTNNPGPDFDPAWSPDGRRIAFVSARAGNLEIHSMNPDGTQVARLTFIGATDEAPAWSPDSKRIVFQSYRTGALALYTMNEDGTSPVGITNFAATNPSWGK